MYGYGLKIAVISRAVVLALMWVAAQTAAPFDGSSPSYLANWDGVYYTAIAERGYRYEHEMAFFPGLPAALRAVSLTTRLSLPVAGAVLSNTAFVAATLALGWGAESFARLALARKWLSPSTSPSSFAKTAMLLHVLSPASVFASVAYTEAPFAALSFVAIGAYLHGMASLPSSHSPSVLAASFLLSGLGAACLRSNGILLAGFVVAAAIGSGISIRSILACLVSVGILAIPYVGFQVWGSGAIAEASAEEGYSGPSLGLYSHIQAKYWGNGLFAYYQIKQIPNFVLAAPVLLASLTVVWSVSLWVIRGGRVRMERVVWGQDPIAILAAHLGFLLLVASVYMHVQVATRFICSSTPLLFWAGALLLSDAKLRPRYGPWILGYACVWNVLGSVMFPLFYPWT